MKDLTIRDAVFNLSIAMLEKYILDEPASEDEKELFGEYLDIALRCLMIIEAGNYEAAMRDLKGEGKEPKK